MNSQFMNPNLTNLCFTHSHLTNLSTATTPTRHSFSSLKSQPFRLYKTVSTASDIWQLVLVAFLTWMMKFEEFLMQPISETRRRRITLKEEVDISSYPRDHSQIRIRVNLHFKTGVRGQALKVLFRVQQVEELQERLNGELKLNIILRSALRGPLLSCPCLSSSVPPKVIGQF